MTAADRTIAYIDMDAMVGDGTMITAETSPVLKGVVMDAAEEVSLLFHNMILKIKDGKLFQMLVLAIKLFLKSPLVMVRLMMNSLDPVLNTDFLNRCTDSTELTGVGKISCNVQIFFFFFFFLWNSTKILQSHDFVFVNPSAHYTEYQRIF